jgi:hypothetical protein
MIITEERRQFAAFAIIFSFLKYAARSESLREKKRRQFPDRRL